MLENQKKQQEAHLQSYSDYNFTHVQKQNVANQKARSTSQEFKVSTLASNTEILTTSDPDINAIGYKRHNLSSSKFNHKNKNYRNMQGGQLNSKDSLNSLQYKDSNLNLESYPQSQDLTVTPAVNK